MSGWGASGFVAILHGATPDRADEIDQQIAAEAVAAALEALGYGTEIIGLGLDLSALQALAAKRPLAVFNLVDALIGDCRLAALVPAALGRLSLRFTGAPFDVWLATLSKIAVKQALIEARLPTPDWSADGFGLGERGRVIVKPVFEHGSLGLDASSVVPAAEAAALIAARDQHFGTAHFAECFIDGREFNLSLLQAGDEVLMLPIAEICFHGFGEGPHIVGYDAKWAPESAAYRGTPRRFGLEAENPYLALELRSVALKCWELFGLSGYARIDFRVSSNGWPYILEVNANPCLSPDAGFAAAAEQDGFSYERLIDTILAAPLRALKASA